MNYSQSLEYLASFTKAGAPVSDLSRFRELTETLGMPQEGQHFVHVAGTNGKGSVCEYISRGLEAAGYVTGKFTSPYITRIEERIQINSAPISESDLAHSLERVRDGVEKTGRGDYSQFELLNAAAFLYFAEKGCDISVIEAGIGGLLDSTNIIAPEISVITTIDLDHCAVLGDTHAEIARHKAGIIKSGSPVVVSPAQREDVTGVIAKKAEEVGAPITFVREADIDVISTDLDGERFLYKGEPFRTRMCGRHQALNAAAAIEAMRLLGLPRESIDRGLREAYVPARMNRIADWIVDGAHNPSGANAAAELLKTVEGSKTLLTGMLTTKDWRGALGILVPLFDNVVAVDCFASNAVPKEEIAGFANGFGKNAVAADSVEDGINRAESFDAAYRVVCGSLYLCGEVMKVLEKNEKLPDK